MKAIVKALCAATLVGLSVLPAQAQDRTIEVGTMSREDLTPSGVSPTRRSPRATCKILAAQTDYVPQDY